MDRRRGEREANPKRLLVLGAALFFALFGAMAMSEENLNSIFRLRRLKSNSGAPARVVRRISAVRIPEPPRDYQSTIKTWHSRGPRGGHGDAAFLDFSMGYG